jgi:hypothetical protein
MGGGGVDLETQVMDKWLAVVNKVMNLQVSSNLGNF